jgi:hypothetical protein
MTVQAHDTITPMTAPRPARRADAGTVRLPASALGPELSR